MHELEVNHGENLDGKRTLTTKESRQQRTRFYARSNDLSDMHGESSIALGVEIVGDGNFTRNKVRNCTMRSRVFSINLYIVRKATFI